MDTISVVYHLTRHCLNYSDNLSSELFLRAVQRLATHSLVREELVGESGVMIISLHRLVSMKPSNPYTIKER